MRKLMTCLKWFLAFLIVAYLSFDTAMGPIYRSEGSIRDFSLNNALILIVSFLAYSALIAVLYLFGSDKFSGLHKKVRAQVSRQAHGLWQYVLNLAYSLTQSWWKIALFLLILWAWVPLFYGVHPGPDTTNQLLEYKDWLWTLSGHSVPYSTSAANIPLTDYPIAHYLWPQNPTFLTNQNGVFLTFFYGVIVYAMMGLFHTGSWNPGLITLCLSQYLFFAFILGRTAQRFFTRSNQTVSKGLRLFFLLFTGLNPLIAISTVALTKSPLFSFLSIWLLGILYQLARRVKLSKADWIELSVATILMLTAVKYGFDFLLVIMFVLLIYWLSLRFTKKNRQEGQAERKQLLKVVFLSLLIPAIIYKIVLGSLYASQLVIPDDPIEAKTIQIMQIARVVKDDFSSIPADTKKQLNIIFDISDKDKGIPMMGAQYIPYFSDPVKSTGAIRGQRGAEAEAHPSYRWQTVTKEDWSHFNKIWLQLGLSHPTEYVDAFMAKTYGYLDIFDPHDDNASLLFLYSMPQNLLDGTYLYSSPLQKTSNNLAQKFTNLSQDSILGLLFRGAFWMVISLILSLVLFLKKKYRTLIWSLPLLSQIVIALDAASNNTDRRMISFFVFFAFLVIAYVVESKGKLLKVDGFKNER